MKVKNLNSSSRKTRILIKETFASLMQEKKDLSKITVKELVERADITRSSFYTHYDNIYDVAGDIQNETMEVLLKNTENLVTFEDFGNCLDEITSYLKEHENIYSMILSSSEAILYADRLVHLISKKIDGVFAHFKEKDEQAELKIIFYTYGSINLIIKYFRKEIDCSLDDINHLMKDQIKYFF